ncbi:Hypothetical predicted protein, partial [Pelobates cultripes]
MSRQDVIFRTPFTRHCMTTTTSTTKHHSDEPTSSHNTCDIPEPNHTGHTPF